MDSDGASISIVMPHRALFLTCAVLIGCSSSNATNPGTGNLTVTISVAAGVTPSITVTGPQGYNKTVTSTTTLAGLVPGSYTVTAPAAASQDSIVGTAYTAAVTGSPALVNAGATASATVSYSALAGSGAVWVVGGFPHANNMIPNAAQAYSAAQLRTTGAPSPITTLTFPSSANTYNIDPSDAVVDSAGDLWIANENSNDVVEYTPASLAASGNPTPAVTITMTTDSAGPIALRFDAHHDLWVLNQYAATVVEFTPAQLASSGSPTPTVTIIVGQSEPPSNELGSNPLGLAFDPAGNLWVANSSEATIAKYSTGQLTTSGSPTPSVTITPQLSTTLNDSAVVAPSGLAFDSQGNLWVGGSELYELSATALTATGTVTPIRWLTPPHAPHGFYGYVTGVAIDDSGDIWFSVDDFGIIGEYTAAQIAAGGDPAPAVEITLAGRFAPSRLVFDPHASGVPLH